jgi:dihydropteroate synthase
MGIINVTPDSFSDGGRFLERGDALAHARRLIADGADLLDIGGESSRPGAEPVPADEQIHRVRPVIEAARAAGIDAPIFVDTRLAAVADAALAAGATGVNDIAALRDDPDLAPLVASRRCPVVLMHMAGTPKSMQADPRYRDVVAEVRAFLAERAAAAVAAGIARDRIAVDPGIGFGKTLDHNLTILAHTDALVELGFSVLVGPSRKRFIGELLGIDDPAGRDTATLAAVAAAVLGGASAVRVHEVAAARDVATLAAAIARARTHVVPGSQPG